MPHGGNTNHFLFLSCFFHMEDLRLCLYSNSVSPQFPDQAAKQRLTTCRNPLTSSQTCNWGMKLSKTSKTCPRVHTPLAEIGRPPQGLNPLDPVSPASLLPPALSWLSPFGSVHSHAPDPSATPTLGWRRPGRAGLQSEVDSETAWPCDLSPKAYQSGRITLSPTLIFEKNCLKQPLGSTFSVSARSRMNFMTIAWWATCSISACFCKFMVLFSKLCITKGAWFNHLVIHLVYLKVDANDNETVGRLLAHQVWVIWEILLTVVPAVQHTWCTHKHISQFW